MEVFQSHGQEGLLTICLDGAEPVVLNFKQKAHISVSYPSKNGNFVVDDNHLTPVQLKTEAFPAVGNDNSAEQKELDHVTEELDDDVVIEKAKHNDNELVGTADRPQNTSEDLLDQSENATMAVESKMGIDGDDDGDDNPNTKSVSMQNKIRAEDIDYYDDDDDHDVGCDDDESFGDAIADVKPSDNQNRSGDIVVKDKKEEEDEGKRVIKERDTDADIKIDGEENCDGSNESSNDLAPKEMDVHSNEENVGEIKSSSKGGPANNSREELIANLMREVTEKKKSIKEMTSSALPPTRERRGVNKAKAPPPPPKTMVYKCNLCDNKFTDSYLLAIHHRPESVKVKCKLCDMECMSKANLIIHQHLKHSRNGGRKAGNACPICSATFEKHTDILSHVRSKHTKEGLYKCCVCRILFQNYLTFKSHLDSHYKERFRKDTPKNKNNPQGGVVGIGSGSQKQGQRIMKTTTSELSHHSRQSSTGAGTVGKTTAPAAAVLNLRCESSSSSSSRRKSQTPMQRRSVMNYEPPAKKPCPPPPPPPRPSFSSAKAGMLPSSRSSTTASLTKSGVVKVPTTSLPSSLSPSSSSLSLSSSKRNSFSPTIKKQVLASRLKPVITPSLLASRKRPLNQLPSSSSRKSLPTVPSAGKSKAFTRGPLITLPRVTLQQKSASPPKRYTKRKYSSANDKLWKCHFCERVFRSKGEYINHKKPSRITHTCHQCGFTSTSKALYMIHEYQKHTNQMHDRYTIANENLTCHICEEPILLNEVLNHVMSKHTGEYPYECCVCKKTSSVYEDWVSHGKSHIRSKEEKSNLASKVALNLSVKTEESEKNNALFCNLCKQDHPNEREFVRHHKWEMEKRKCEICSVTCYTQAGHVIHRYLSHGLLPGDGDQSSSSCSTGSLKPWEEDDVTNDGNPDEATCPCCLELFPLKDLVSHVMTVHTLESQYKCCTCKATIATLDQYMDHCDFHLGRKLYSRGTHCCKTCGLRFESRIRLAKHKVQHKPFCPYCETEFSSKAVLEVHLKNFHIKDMTPCHFCGKLFADLGSLAEHERNHYFYKKTPCPICGLIVTCVAKHIARVHPKPDTEFLCNLCGQKFRLRSDLSRHMTTHSADRKYECDICKKTFKRSSGLRRHAQSHLQDRQFHECPICGKKCSQRNNLSVHMRVHSTTKAFTCEICGQGFNYNQSLQTHIRKKHMEESTPNAIAINAAKTTTANNGASMRAATRSLSSSTATAAPSSSQEQLVILNVNSVVSKQHPTPDNVSVVTDMINSQPSSLGGPIPILNYPPEHSSIAGVGGGGGPTLPASSVVSAAVYPNSSTESSSLSHQSQHYYPADMPVGGGYAPAPPPINAVASFQRSYNDLINTIVMRSDHDHHDNNNNSNSSASSSQQPHQSYPPLYYHQQF